MYKHESALGTTEIEPTPAMTPMALRATCLASPSRDSAARELPSRDARAALPLSVPARAARLKSITRGYGDLDGGVREGLHFAAGLHRLRGQINDGQLKETGAGLK